MRLAAIQYRPPKGQPDAARRGLIELVRQAGDHGARLIVAPEMATTGYVFASREAIEPHTEPSDGPTVTELAALSRELDAVIVCGYAERDGDALYNSAAVVQPDGAVANYRKNLLYELDQTWAEAGSERVVVPTALGHMVPGICMDLNDDSFVAFVERARPAVVPFCTNWIDQGFDVVPYWRYRLRGWRGWFVAANTWGVDAGVPFRGRSAVLAPGGRIACQAAATGDAVIVATLDESR